RAVLPVDERGRHDQPLRSRGDRQSRPAAFEQPFVAAHEWAHLAGYANESEASFVGFLTCMHSAAPAAYSGWLFLYWQVYGEVSAADRRQLASLLDEGPRGDINAIAERVQ